MSKPHDHSGPRAPYFLSIQAALIGAGIAWPTLVIDKARLSDNVRTLKTHLPAGMEYRIVAKSLPSIGLLSHIRELSGTDRLMTFNQPMLSKLSVDMPDASQLLGKPLPVRAARQYFETLPAHTRAAADNVEWLIDSPERLQQYSSLASDIGQPLKIVLELDVGLHRGGFEPGPALGAAIESIEADPNLIFKGFMGYEPHIPSLPTALGWRDKALKAAWGTYTSALEQTTPLLGADRMSGLTRNAAGSPTYRYYQSTDIANEVSAGSCLVKPTHFDTELLTPHQPASFIATPVIKSLDKTRLPGLEFASSAGAAWNPNSKKTVFIHGGHWLAEPVDPPGLEYNKTFGRSSNQEMLNGGPELSIQPDEFVFFRPQQSEAVFLQFGDIAVYEDGAIVDTWPVFPVSA
ncbi:alanine racemase [uncultured Hyphomonas sp.]|uniref:alanine racemase n=1 Tax=uncultured Hyphomonas sp. TaxID=225298 RepID=UPI002AAC3CF3|nr:alanine racemase [uncultured Hyphomonas sp.]